MKYTASLLLIALLAQTAFAARAPIKPISNDPYSGAIVIDAATGQTLFEDQPDRTVYPASVIKLMTMLIVLEQIESGQLKLTDSVPVTEEAERMGGSQVYLKAGEVFTLDDMLYALSIKSANDVAVALAIKVAGSTENFVKLMNRRAAQMGLSSSVFHSVHGLPPDEGQKPDVTTARDVARLSRAILKLPKALHYTSTQEKWFRNNTFEMLSHNRLLKEAEGCDGLKTGYYRAAGFSISATAQRDGRRVIAVVMGSKVREVRDAKAKELLGYGFMQLSALPAPPPEPEPALKPTMDRQEALARAAEPEDDPETEPEVEPEKKGSFGRTLITLLIGVALGLGVTKFLGRGRR